MDVCTTAKKLGVQQVTDVVYETFAEFKGSKSELDLARKYGVSIYDGFVPVSTERGGIVNFKHRFVDNLIKVKADLIVLTIGQDADLGVFNLQTENGTLCALPDGVFAAGDLVAEEKTVVYGVASGKRVAEEVDAYLGGP